MSCAYDDGRNWKGGIPLTSIGYIQVRAYTSNAQIPLENTAIAVTAPDGTALALRLTNRSGQIDLIEIPVPERSASQTPDTGEVPYTTVNLYARRSGYEQIEMENLQIFPGVVTVQNLEMIPIPESPDLWDPSQVLDTPPQNL